MNKKLTAGRLMKMFDLKPVNKKGDTEREVLSAAIHRTGLELAGINTGPGNETNIIGWGTKENKYLSKQGKEKAIPLIENSINDVTPMIILSQGVKEEVTKWIVEVANKKGVPVVSTELHLATIGSTVGAYLVRKFAESYSAHGSLVIINGMGVMITGKSGIGKSEAVLELIQGGHSFVSDDTVILKKIGSQFIGEPADLTKGILEARGIGLIDIPTIYGHKAVKDYSVVDLVIEMVDANELESPDRLGNMELEYQVLGSSIKLIQIPVNQGRTIASLIEAATNVYIASKNGVNPLQIMSERRGN